MTVHFETTDDLQEYMTQLGADAKNAANLLRLTTTQQRNDALNVMADEIEAAKNIILASNKKDMQAGATKRLSDAMLDRLALDENRIRAIANGLRSIAKLPDPVGSVDETWTQPNGLAFSKVRVPIGVIGIIYESRPNVTADAGGLCIKSGNACILRGGSEAANSNLAIHKAMIRGLQKAGLPKASVTYIQTTDRKAVGHLLGGLNNCVDLIIPRGGKNLIARVQEDARVPVLAHLEGLCHTYIHADANIEKATEILLNAKLRRTGVCRATETLPIDKSIAESALSNITNPLKDNGCEFRGDEYTQKLIAYAKLATREDFATEHLASILNVKVVNGVDEALAHIATFGSGHTDCIITENNSAAEQFLRDVDSAICMHNCSTQFADGGEFGFGAEIGIATGRMHARGPVGAQHLTTYKYQVRGSGQVRP